MSSSQEKKYIYDIIWYLVVITGLFFCFFACSFSYVAYGAVLSFVLFCFSSSYASVFHSLILAAQKMLI